MPVTLEGSCRCGALSFRVSSHTPQPYQLCYCSICRKTAGGGGFAINLGADAMSLETKGGTALAVYRAEIADEDGICKTSSGERNFCRHCATALWLFDPTWPDLIHPFASAIDSELPGPPERVHLMLRYKPSWIEPDIRPNDQQFDLYPAESIEDWHKSRGLWVE